ncbi:MAG: ATP synthase F1 subunit epsilon [Candidatus Binataceae bacterium]
MAGNFPFRLITPTGAVFDGPVEEVVAISPIGEFGVLAEHIDFITSLIPSLLSVRISSDRRDDYVVTGGLATVKGGAMTILADDVQMPDRLDRAAVAEELASAEHIIGAKSYYDADYADAQRAIQLARARTRAADSKRAPR